MVGRESPGSLAFIRILVLVKSGQKSACSTMPSIFTPYWSLFTLYNHKTFCYSSTVKWSIYIYLTGKGVNLRLPRHRDENHHQQFGAVCGNDLIVLTKEKSGSGDWQNKSFVNCGFSQI